MPDFKLISEKTVKARIKHTCHWCGQDIEAGSQYVRLVGIFDGFQHSKYHPECDQAVGEYCMDYPDIGYEPYSGVRGEPEMRD